MRWYFLTLALLFIAFTNPSIAQQQAESQAETQVVVAEGAPLTVECALRVEQRAEWRADGAAPAPDLRAAGERPARAGGGLRASLHAPRARPAHAGLYTCEGGAAARRVRVRVLPAGEASPAPSDAPEERLRAIVWFKLFQPLTLNCSSGATGIKYEWYKNDTLIQGIGSSPKSPVLLEDGAVLVYKRAHEDDYGNYSCKIGNEIGGLWEAKAYSLARVPANTNVVEGQKFSITCKLIGKPYERVSWTFSPPGEENRTVPLAMEGRFSARDSAAGVPGGVLEVAAAKREDAGEYTCVPARADAHADDKPAASVLRVKDVYAALWPFLGICLEVFILCAVILVYEKRRTKPEMDDSDADAHDQ